MKIKRLSKLFIPPIFIKTFKLLTGNYNDYQSTIKLNQAKKLHLGSGGNIIPGWSNIDLKSNGKIIGLDLTKPLPIKSESIDFIFSEHFIEHITLKQAESFIGECFRVLKKGGVLRISTPSLEKLIEEYLAGKSDEWRDLGWEPNTPCQMINEGLRSWGHQHVYDTVDLKGLLNSSGFNKIQEVEWHESKYKTLRNIECRPYHDDLIIEVTK